MSVPRWISPLFWIAAAYDGVLGLLFLFAPGWPFRTFDVTPPNHMGYVQFPAALLIIFALMFGRIARDPAGNRALILYGILLKASYCGVASFYWITATLPWMWQPFVLIDLVMGVLFAAALAILPRR